MVDLVADKFAEDILLMDIRPVSAIADYFVVCSAASERQADAIRDYLLEELSKMGVRPLHVEGTSGSGWLLLDYSSVIAHIFLPTTRQYYKLEQLWKNARIVVRML
jgi:ribosome-associated protein